MHAYLGECINKLAELWEKDPAAVAFSVNGSGGRGEDDEWSDADVLLVVKDGEYDRFRKIIKETLAGVCGDIRLWLPEGETEKSVNYAFLFEKNGEQFLTDHALYCESQIIRAPSLDAGRIIFDRGGALTLAGKRFKESNPDTTLSAARETIEAYLVYAYLNGKYYRRGDAEKMLYVQQTLLGLHLRLLNYVYPGAKFTGWWCKDISYVSNEHKTALLSYFTECDMEKIAGRIDFEIKNFSGDAKNVLSMFNENYPVGKELFVRRQLADAGLPVERHA